MKKLGAILIILLALFVSVSFVSANENVTADGSGIMEQGSDNSVILGSDLSDNAGNDSLQDGETSDNENAGDVIQPNDTSDEGNGSDDSQNGSGPAGNNQTNSSTGNDDKPAPVVKKASKISFKNIKTYAKFKTKVSAKLTSDGKPLANKVIKISVAGKTFYRRTNSKGVAICTITLKKAKTYTVKFSYSGDKKFSATVYSGKIYAKSPTKTYLKLGDKYLNYRQGSKCLFYVKLVDNKGKPIKNQIVIFKVAGKTYKAKTNKYGHAKIYLNLKKGKHKVRYSFSKKAPYLGSSGAYKIKVRSPMPKGNGYWIWPMHMKSVDLKSLAAHGTKHLFLHVEAISAYGQSYVVSFIGKAHRYGMKVHLWMQVCCVGETWTSPVRDDGSFKYGFINGKINEAKRYAKIKGVDGIHFDYVRFGGTAHIHKNSDKVLNYFVKKASYEVHKIKSDCIVSAALMPEPGMMMYYYGQDVPTMSKYLDALLPMVYKGNYHQSTSWIKSVTHTFAKQSKGAQIWTGLQSYRSDDDTRSLSHAELLKDAKAAKAGGAKGIILFRIGLSCNFNFNKV